MKNKILCPECQNEIETDEVLNGDIIECKFCGSELRVVGKDTGAEGKILVDVVEEEK